jgi:hypothetical protein
MTYQVAEDGSITKLLDDDRKLILPAEDNGTPEWAEYKAWAAQQETATVRIRARDERGRYVGDNPSTPDANEAYVEVPLKDA